MLGKLPVLWHHTNLNNSRASASCACSRCGREFVWPFYFSLLKYAIYLTCISFQLCISTQNSFILLYIVICKGNYFQKNEGVVGWCEGAG